MNSIPEKIATTILMPDGLLNTFDTISSFIQSVEIWVLKLNIVLLFVLYLVMLYYLAKAPMWVYQWYNEYRGMIRKVLRLDFF